MSEKDINNLKEMLVDFNEYSTDYTKTRCRELEKTIKNTLKEIERLNKRIKELEEGFKATTEDLCETAEELEKTGNKIKMALDYIQNAEGNDINYIATLLLGYPVEIEEKRKQVLEVIKNEQR